MLNENKGSIKSNPIDVDNTQNLKKRKHIKVDNSSDNDARINTRSKKQKVNDGQTFSQSHTFKVSPRILN